MNSSSSDHSPTLENSSSSMAFHGPVQKAYANTSRQGTTEDMQNEPTSPGIPPHSPSLLRTRTFALSQRAATLLKPAKALGPPPTTKESLKAVLKASRLNILLLCIPASWALNWGLPDSNGSKDTVVFVVSFLAIIPLANLLAFSTEELGLRVGQTLAGLMNATLGNAVELIVAIIALVKCELRVVQASLVGSILSNLLLVLGMCFFAGGLKYSEQGFGLSATQLNSSLLAISVIAVLLPAAFHFAATDLSQDQEDRAILNVSHGVAIILLFIYAGYLFFQLYSHTTLYQDKGEHVIVTTQYTEPKFRFKRKSRASKEGSDVESAMTTSATQAPSRTGTNGTLRAHSLLNPLTNAGPGNFDANQTIAENGDVHEEKEEEEEKVQMNLPVTVGLLVSVTVLVAVTAEWLVGSINGLTEAGVIGKEFVGIILLPIVGNAAEHMTAVTVSVKDKLNLSIGVAVGSSIQIALFVIPSVYCSIAT
ncbi:Sodium/calcium exchanger protein-domain-containing protein [Panaeolus papilionaceus]|nr:Sodium/calcium exchanger protein-domain-containing protein [Panaeolus papilionaceus]